MKQIKHILIVAMVLVMVATFANANIPPAPVELNNDTGEYWVNYTWSEDTNHPDNNNVTDSFNVSMNGMWYNGTATFLHKSVGPGGWANIEVWAYNATGNGNMSVGSAIDSVQAPGAATELSYKCGYIPPPMDLSHLDEIPVKRIQAPCALPSFDWRDSGSVTPVKDQCPCGTCWIFGTTSVLESAVLINGGAEYNFSEQSVALCVDRSWTYLYDSPTDPCNSGGWGGLAAEVFIKKGSVPESCNPYNTLDLNCDGSCVCDYCVPVKRVDGYRLVTNDGSEIGEIKTAVHDHGPVTMSFNYANTSGCANVYDDPTWGIIYDYYPGPESSNHLVSIVGWNDSVPHPDEDHDGTGAWIVKNSWGTGWGNDGYFYLAYNSSCVEGIAYLEYKDPVPGEELLYWDEAGFVGDTGYADNDGAWMASVFTVDHSGSITHVDFWTTSNNAEYEIYVWDGFFGSELVNQTGNCPECGYYSIPLSTPIPVDAGQQFTVGVNMTTPGYTSPIPIEFNMSGVDTTIQTNVSFIRYDSTCDWTDLADSGTNACLRARVAPTYNCTCGDICVNTSGWWRDRGVLNANGMPIQAAVDAAAAGETICVAAGSYTENVYVNKRVTLQGEGADVVTVTAASADDDVFCVTADYVNISGFTVTGARNPWNAGISLSTNVDHCNIFDNSASHNYAGIFLHDSGYNEITNNIANSNGNSGIRLDYIKSNNNNLTNNTANSNGDSGIFLFWSSNNNTLTGNTANSNEDGIGLFGPSNTLTGNTANSNTQYGIYFCEADANNVSCNWVQNNGVNGFRLCDGSTGNTIEHNNIVVNGVYNSMTNGYEYQFYNDQSNEVEAKHNWWGTDNKTRINASIYDRTYDASKGHVTIEPAADGAPPCAPIPELKTILFFAVGLLMLAGYVRIGRKT